MSKPTPGTKRRPVSTRKQPSQKRSAATVDAILQAAAAILQKHGWDGFTTNLVAQRANVNIASLYQYFPNKQAIVAELQKRHWEQVIQPVPPLPPTRPLADFLRQAIEDEVRRHKVDPALHRVIANELPRSVRVAARGLVKDDHHWEMATAPLMQVPDLEVASFIYAHVIHSVVHEASLSRPQLLDDPLFVDELVTLLDRYLRRPRK